MSFNADSQDNRQGRTGVALSHIVDDTPPVNCEEVANVIHSQHTTLLSAPTAPEPFLPRERA